MWRHNEFNDLENVHTANLDLFAIVLILPKITTYLCTALEESKSDEKYKYHKYTFPKSLFILITDLICAIQSNKLIICVDIDQYLYSAKSFIAGNPRCNLPDSIRLIF